MSAALSDVCPRLPSTSKISPFNVFPDVIWRKIADMGLVLVTEKKETKLKKKTKSSKKRKAETKSETQ